MFTNRGFEEHDIQLLKQNLREDGTWWAGLLEATGGKLELSKCFFYLVSWKFDSKGNAIPETMEEQNDMENQIMIQSNNQEGVYLKQKEL
jgi:hypothetical protein